MHIAQCRGGACGDRSGNGKRQRLHATPGHEVNPRRPAAPSGVVFGHLDFFRARGPASAKSRTILPRVTSVFDACGHRLQCNHARLHHSGTQPRSQGPSRLPQQGGCISAFKAAVFSASRQVPARRAISAKARPAPDAMVERPGRRLDFKSETRSETLKTPSCLGGTVPYLCLLSFLEHKDASLVVCDL